MFPGDGLQTFDGSQATVDISVGEFVRVSRTKPVTVWRLGQFSVDDETIIELDQGTIFLFYDSEGPSPKPLKVTGLQCFRGSCLLENNLGLELLFDEQKTATTMQSPPRKSIVMSKTETQVFVALPEAVSGEVAIPTPEPAAPPT